METIVLHHDFLVSGHLWEDPSLGRPLDQRGDSHFISYEPMRLFRLWKALIKMQAAGKEKILNPYQVKSRLLINVFAGTSENGPLDGEQGTLRGLGLVRRELVYRKIVYFNPITWRLEHFNQAYKTNFQFFKLASIVRNIHSHPNSCPQTYPRCSPHL